MTGDRNECVALIERAQTGDAQAMDALVRKNLALVKYVVKRFLNRGREYDDLYQLGCLGLVKAIRNFDTGMDTAFSTYAVPVILGEIRRFLRDDSALRVSRSIRENARRIAGFVADRLAEGGEEPTLSEISRQLGIEREEAVLAMESRRSVRSLSEPVIGDATITLADTIGEDTTEETDRRIELGRMLESLDEKERAVLIRRYMREETQSSIAQDLGMTQVQVSRLEKRLLERLRAQAQGYLNEPCMKPEKSSVAK